MDETDFHILAALKRDPLASHAELARDVGLSPPAVRGRVARLRDAGVLRGFFGLPAAEVFGRFPRIFPFRGPRVKAKDLEAILQVDSVVWASLKHDGAITVEAYLETETDTPPAALVERLGFPIGAYGSSLPAPRVENPVLSSLDWRVLEVLVPEPRTPIAEVAGATGLTPKTVRRRRDRLMRDGLFAVIPLVEGAPSPGLLMFNLALYGVPADDRAKVLRAVPRKVLINETEDPEPMMYLLCRADSLSEVMDLERRLRSMEAVADVQVTLNIRAMMAVDRLLSWIRLELERGEARARGSTRGRASG